MHKNKQIGLQRDCSMHDQTQFQRRKRFHKIITKQEATLTVCFLSSVDELPCYAWSFSAIARPAVEL